MKRITMYDIAKAAGVSHTTVSMALRDSPTISGKTKLRIKEISERLGYRPDPALSSLILYRLANRPAKYHATLAWINVHPQREMVRSVPVFNGYFMGARKRAEEIGYKVEEFWVHEPGLTPERLSQILVNRGIQGLLLAPSCNAKVDFELPWERFSTIAFGYSNGRRFHIVTNAQYYSMRTAYRRLCELGYQRIGFHVNGPDISQRTDFNYTAGYLVESALKKKAPLLLESSEGLSYDQFLSQLKKWVSENKLDAIIINHDEAPLFQIAKELNLHVPNDLAVITLVYSPRRPTLAGIDQHAEQTGRSAVDLLVGMIQRNELGLPALPMETLIPGRWMDGASIEGK